MSDGGTRSGAIHVTKAAFENICLECIPGNEKKFFFCHLNSADNPVQMVLPVGRCDWSTKTGGGIVVTNRQASAHAKKAFLAGAKIPFHSELE